jgi:hypothetical protein
LLCGVVSVGPHEAWAVGFRDTGGDLLTHI